MRRLLRSLALLGIVCGVDSSIARAQLAPGVYRMVSLGTDTSADRMALRGAPLPALSPIGRILGGTITIDTSGRVIIQTTLIRTGRSAANATCDTTQIARDQIGNVVPLAGPARRFLHRVNGRWYFLPGAAVRIALARER